MPSRTFSFWFIWLVPFVSLILIAVGLVGFLSLQNGQRAVNDLSEQLLERTNQLVTQHLESYLAVPKNLVRLNAVALEHGTLDRRDFKGMGDYFGNKPRPMGLVGSTMALLTAAMSALVTYQIRTINKCSSVNVHYQPA